MKLEDKFYFVGNYRKKAFPISTPCFSFQFILFPLLFTDARNDYARQE